MITNEMIVAFLECPRKAYLMTKNEEATITDYELLNRDLHGAIRRKFLQKFSKNCDGNETLITRNLLMQQRDLIQNAKMLSRDFDIIYDVLQKVSEPSPLGKFSYIPIQTTPRQRILKDDKLLIAILSIPLGDIQGKKPNYGRVVSGNQLKSSKIGLNNYYHRAEIVLSQLFHQKSLESAPEPDLNQNCLPCRFYKTCRKYAVEKDHLSLLGGINKKQIAKYESKGIFTVHQLSYTFRPRKDRKNKQHLRRRAFSPELKALSIREQKIHVHQIPDLPVTPTEIYFDIEGIPDESFYYLIGLIVINDDKEKEQYFWADNKEDQAAIFTEFFQTISQYKEYTLFHYGSYEIIALKHMSKEMADEDSHKVSTALGSCCNLLSILYSNVYLPTYTNGLKEVGAYLGFKWSATNATGLQSIVWRKRWEQTGHNAYKSKLITYNNEDCRALRRVKVLLDSIVATDPNVSDPTSPIVHIQTLAKPSRLKFMSKEFALPEIERIRDVAYFNYQRERVHARTNKNLRRKGERNPSLRKTVHKPNKKTSILARVCPRCKSREIEASKAISKKVVDLKFFNWGVKRWIVQHDSFMYWCQNCRNIFNPARFRRIRHRYGHKLISWVTFLHIVNRESVRQIASNLYELFGIDIPKTTIHNFKTYVSNYYKHTFDIIKQEILSSDVIYVDETPLSMRDGSGYAWVFTNLENVISLYKPTREGDFLKEYLESFRGILVSDFYTAYDSVNCLHQKCLIHLIRDFNDDLLKNPFDEEFKDLAKKFTHILQAVVETIDKYGLKRRHLHKHKKAVLKFYDYVLGKDYTSEAAQQYQKRIQKNRDDLFRFLDYDNVAWNNGNAEHAIKLLATHTNDNLKFCRTTRMEEYLTIMSLYQTCKYRGISLLSFMLSEKIDINSYCTNRASRNR
jgi:predicted RecB family nuclease